jgi:tetratricopeptide (TPR) repeat protein
MRRPRVLAWPVHVLFLALAVAAVYHHTLDVPFYLDDDSSIRENSLIYQWQGLEALRRFGPLRVVCYLSFAANYQWSHFDPSGYHLTNIVIHFLAGVAVYGLVRGLLRTPRLMGLATERMRYGLPLLAAALFLVHPLQTQAVTYVVQRLASMVALFYVAALATYLQARLAPARAPRYLWAGACILFAGLALFTKENSASLPIALLLLELVFFPLRRREVVIRLTLAAVGLALVWVIASIAFGGTPFSLASFREVTSQTWEISRLTYGATQMPILWIYLRLFVWPAGLRLDYDVPTRHFSDPIVLLALGGHLLVLALGIWAWRRRPWVTFGIGFYYVAHLVESGFIPVTEMAFEHRTYLPNLGLCLLAAWLVLERWPRRLLDPRAAPAVAVVVLVLLGVTTWRRNRLWRDPIALYENNARLEPGKARVWGALGKHLLEAKRPADAERALRESLRLQIAGNPSAGVSAPDIINLATALHDQGGDQAAMAMIDRHIDQRMNPPERALMHVARGNIHFARGRMVAAEESFRAALALDPYAVTARGNLASTWALTGRMASAESLFHEVLAIDPDHTKFREYMLQARAMRYFEEGQRMVAGHRHLDAHRAYDSSRKALEEVLRLNPDNEQARAGIEVIRRLIEAPPSR